LQQALPTVGTRIEVRFERLTAEQDA
jgi:hypothetical protein